MWSVPNSLRSVTLWSVLFPLAVVSTGLQIVVLSSLHSEGRLGSKLDYQYSEIIKEFTCFWNIYNIISIQFTVRNGVLGLIKKI